MLSVRNNLLNTLLISAMAIGLLFSAGNPSTAAGLSSCVKCHTDEKALTKNLSPEKPKASGMTSGAG